MAEVTHGHPVATVEARRRRGRRAERSVEFAGRRLDVATDPLPADSTFRPPTPVHAASQHDPREGRLCPYVAMVVPNPNLKYL